MEYKAIEFMVFPAMVGSFDAIFPEYKPKERTVREFWERTAPILEKQGRGSKAAVAALKVKFSLPAVRGPADITSVMLEELCPPGFRQEQPATFIKVLDHLNKLHHEKDLFGALDASGIRGEPIKIHTNDETPYDYGHMGAWKNGGEDDLKIKMDIVNGLIESGAFRKYDPDKDPTPWVHAVNWVPKPGDKKWRMAVDYRPLNARTVAGVNNVMPTVAWSLQQQVGFDLYHMFDMSDYFFQLHLVRVMLFRS
jgi:hypothetical protein